MQLNQSSETLNWLAGFFDGEGSVSIVYAKHTGKRQDRSFYLTVTVAQKREDIDMVGCLKALYDGDIAYWVDKNGVLVGTNHPDEPVEIIEEDYCGLVFHGGEPSFILCDLCVRRKGILW